MGTYDLQRLGSTGFQEVVSALAIKALGAHVRPMGSGKDGGRDMLVNGVIVWSADGDHTDSETWDGTTIFQVKHKQGLESPQKNAVWFWERIKAELDAWSDPASERGAVPDYLVFATNVLLTPVSGRGGFDRINSKIQGYIDDLSDESAEDRLARSAQQSARQKRLARRDRMSRLRSWRLWDGNQINGLLDAHDGVRRAFDGFLTAGDVLADLSRLSTTLNQDELGPALRDHARRALLAERRVYFHEAGDEGKGEPVERVVVDLPVLVRWPQDRGKAPKIVVPDELSTNLVPTTVTLQKDSLRVRTRVVKYVLERGEQVLKPSMTALTKPRHLVITGAPGNGKSTVAKFLTHAYRVALLCEDISLGGDHREVVAGTESALARIDCGVPLHRRWPVNIDLAEFAMDQAANGQYTLMHWIASKLSHESASKEFPRWGLQQWLQSWPSFIVLDGLDEVTEPAVRQTLIAEIEAFVGEAESNDCDMLVVVTTRPTGYSDEMPPSMFERIDLADLSVEDAVEYGRVVTRVRVPDDRQRREAIITLLEQAAEERALQHLLRTPLQVLIMTIIAESSRHFSPSRYDLFWKYYQTIEQRERSKQSSQSRLLRDHARQVLSLHQRVGLRLQQQAETATGSESVISPEDLREVAWQVLADGGYEPSTHDKRLLDQILNAATHRLVLLTPRPDGGYGFDVRSLQELMAAYAITTSELDIAIEHMRLIAASPHWRNTFLFAAGRCFADSREGPKEDVLALVLDLDEDAPERLGSVFPVGPEVAMEMVDDGMVSEPKYLRPLVTHAMKALGEPAGFEVTGFTRMLMSAAAESDAVRRLIADGLCDALGGSAMSRRNAESVQQEIQNIGDAMGARIEVLSLASVRRDSSKALPAEPVADWAAFREHLREYAVPDNERLLAVPDILDAVQQADGFRDARLDDLVELLTDPDNAFVVDEALRHIAAGEPRLMGILRHDMLPGLWRRPVELNGGQA